jgi:hypothetical protein
MSLKLDTPFFSKESMIAAVSRGSIPSPAYLAPIVQKYHDLAAKYADAEGNHPNIWDIIMGVRIT